jgi:hypothetical protein
MISFFFAPFTCRSFLYHSILSGNQFSDSEYGDNKKRDPTLIRFFSCRLEFSYRNFPDVGVQIP